MKQLSKHYNGISVVRDTGAMLATSKAAARKVIEKIQAAGDKAAPQRKILEAELTKFRISLVAGRRVVGVGDTQAAALADAARRLGRP